MAALLLHGNPETPAVWADLVAFLPQPCVTPSLPGFGSASPGHWPASMDDYATWLVGELEREAARSGPVDLVGHDWGGILALRAVTLRPDLVRSFVSDSIGALHERHQWHDLAQVWRTPAEGEAFFTRQRSSPIEEVAKAYEAMGMPASISTTLVSAVDEEFARCVLALYRSADNEALRTWGEELEAAELPPGMYLHPTADPFSGRGTVAGEMASRIGARTGRLEDEGHWWMCTAPEASAALLAEFWSSAGRGHATQRA